MHGCDFSPRQMGSSWRIQRNKGDTGSGFRHKALRLARLHAGYPKASKPSIRALKAIINCGAGRHSDTALEAGGVAQLCNASRRSLVVDWDGPEQQLFTCEASISLGF